jgi:hypothetical protein
VATDLQGLNRKLDNLADSLSKDTRKMLNAVGMEGKTIGRNSVTGDIGDLSMSNWRRGRPIQIGLRFDLRSKASGPLRVLEQGRSAGMSKGRKRKGRVGSTAGRGTWTAATDRMAKDLPKVVHEHTRTQLRKLFG